MKNQIKKPDKAEIEKLLEAGDAEGLYKYLRSHGEYIAHITDHLPFYPPGLVSWAAFGRAIVLNQPCIVNRLLSQPEFKIDPNSSDSGWVPIVSAAAQGSIEIIEILLKHGAAVNQSGRSGRTALMVAATNRYRRKEINLFLSATHSRDEISLSIIKLLLEHKADVNLSDPGGNTALLLAARSFDDTRAIEMLIAAGADPYHVNNNKETALDMTYVINIKNKLKKLRKEFFCKKYSSKLICSIDGQLYIKQEDLKGRGEGEAAFYLRENGREYLLKREKFCKNYSRKLSSIYRISPLRRYKRTVEISISILY